MLCRIVVDLKVWQKIIMEILKMEKDKEKKENWTTATQLFVIDS